MTMEGRDVHQVGCLPRGLLSTQVLYEIMSNSFQTTCCTVFILNRHLAKDVVSFCLHHNSIGGDCLLEAPFTIPLWPFTPMIVIVNSGFDSALKSEVAGSSWLAYSHALSHKKSIGMGSRSRESGSKQGNGYGGWCLELRLGGRYGDACILYTKGCGILKFNTSLYLL